MFNQIFRPSGINSPEKIEKENSAYNGEPVVKLVVWEVSNLTGNTVGSLQIIYLHDPVTTDSKEEICSKYRTNNTPTLVTKQQVMSRLNRG